MPRSNSGVSAVFGGVLALLAGCAPGFFSRQPAAESGPACPIESLGERPEDCPWAGWVREFEKDPRAALPEAIRISLERDRADLAPGGMLLEAWGLSQNFDEGARAEIVLRPVLDAVFSHAGQTLLERPVAQPDRTVGHAGLLHTYGYLLSNLKTPYGYKRARWVMGSIERGLGLEPGELGPDAWRLSPRATLLSQLTGLLMRVATAEDPAEWERWRARLEPRLTAKTARFLAHFDPQNIQRVVEKAGEGPEAPQWVTDLVPLPHDPSGAMLLVYSQRTRRGVRLITGFPVQRGYTLPRLSPVRPRFNAWVD